MHRQRSLQLRFGGDRRRRFLHHARRVWHLRWRRHRVPGLHQPLGRQLRRGCVGRRRFLHLRQRIVHRLELRPRGERSARNWGLHLPHLRQLHVLGCGGDCDLRHRQRALVVGWQRAVLPGCFRVGLWRQCEPAVVWRVPDARVRHVVDDWRGAWRRRRIELRI